MATSKPNSHNKDDEKGEDYFDIDACTSTPLSLLLKIQQPSTTKSGSTITALYTMAENSLVEPNGSFQSKKG